MDVLHVDCNIIKDIQSKILKKRFSLNCNIDTNNTNSLINNYLINLGCNYIEKCLTIKYPCDNKTVKKIEND